MVRVNAPTLKLLDQLLATGLYGDSRPEAIRRLMGHGFEHAVRAGIVQLVPVERPVEIGKPEMPRGGWSRVG